MYIFSLVSDKQQVFATVCEIIVGFFFVCGQMGPDSACFHSHHWWSVQLVSSAEPWQEGGVLLQGIAWVTRTQSLVQASNQKEFRWRLPRAMPLGLCLGEVLPCVVMAQRLDVDRICFLSVPFIEKFYLFMCLFSQKQRHESHTLLSFIHSFNQCISTYWTPVRARRWGGQKSVRMTILGIPWTISLSHLSFLFLFNSLGFSTSISPPRFYPHLSFLAILALLFGTHLGDKSRALISG